MRLKKQVLLKLEALEDRWVPARITYAGGTLLIYNNVGLQVPSITLSSVGNKVSVTLDSAPPTTYNNVGNIFVQGGNANTTCNASGLTNYTGNLTISTGNGNDAVTLGGSGTGNVTLIGGNGVDTITLAAGYKTAGSVQFTSTRGNATIVTNGVRIGGDGTNTFTHNTRIN
jgi:hypothetical protein